MIRLIPFLSFLFISNILLSQVVNIENKRIYDDTAGWSGSIDASFSAFQNKDLLLTGSLRPRVQYKSKRNYVLFLTDWIYSKGSNQVFANSGMVHLRYAYRLGKLDSIHKGPWKWESYAQVQYNELLDQRVRALAGSGIRWKFIDGKSYKFFVGSSGFFEYEDIQSTSEIIQTVRWSNYLSWYVDPKAGFAFTAATYFQPNIQDFNDYRLLGQYAISFKMFKRLDFRLEYSTFFDSKPPTGVRNWIFSSSVGLRLRLGE